MKKIAIIYGSTTDNTKQAANLIAAGLQSFAPSVADVAKCSAADFESADCLILGTSTWGSGDIQDDWYDMFAKLRSANLAGKTVALFGLGDSDSYPDTFVDGMGELYEFFTAKGCQFIGSVPTDGYSFDDSRAVVDGRFVGLALNADGESHLTDERIARWLQTLQTELA